MKRVEVEVITPLPDNFGLCTTCEAMLSQARLDKPAYERHMEEYPPEWHGDFQRISTTIINLAEDYGDRIIIRIFDPRSLQGLYKSIRHGIRKYPTFIINNRQKVFGTDRALLDAALNSVDISGNTIG